MVFFEAPHRIADTLTAMAEAFGSDRPAAVCRELTKTYEEVRRGTVTDLGSGRPKGSRGEITVVVQGAEAAAADPAHAVGEVLARVARGIRLKDAAGEVAAETGLSKKALYDAALAPPAGDPARRGARVPAGNVRISHEVGPPCRESARGER